MSAHIGRRSAVDFAPQVKGLELPGYEPRALQTMALGLAVGARGADHNKSGAYEADFSEQSDRRRLTPAAAHKAIATEDKAAILDSLILCKFLRGVLTDFYGEAAAMWCDSNEQLTKWCQDTQPKTLYTRTCGAEVDIDCDELIRLCRGLTLH